MTLSSRHLRLRGGRNAGTARVTIRARGDAPDVARSTPVSRLLGNWFSTSTNDPLATY